MLSNAYEHMSKNLAETTVLPSSDIPRRPLAYAFKKGIGYTYNHPFKEKGNPS